MENKARNDKVDKLKILLEDKDKKIKKFDETIEVQQYEIYNMSKKIQMKSDKISNYYNHPIKIAFVWQFSPIGVLFIWIAREVAILIS